MRTFYALFMARNKEFMRDRGTLAWNFLFPFLAVFAMAFIFSGNERELYKVAVMGAGNGARAEESTAAAREFLETRYVQFVPAEDLAAAQNKVRHHQFDMALDLSEGVRYWINPSNPKGYFLERVLWGSGALGVGQPGRV